MEENKFVPEELLRKFEAARIEPETGFKDVYSDYRKDQGRVASLQEKFRGQERENGEESIGPVGEASGKRLGFLAEEVASGSRSALLVAGPEALIKLIDYPLVEDNIFDLKGVVSRKKQLLPYLAHCLKRGGGRLG